MNKNRFKTVLLMIIGSTSVALGGVGLILPVLPTTPFLLLACFCYMRSSKKLYDKLMKHKIFGTYIYNYVTYKAISKRSKIISVILLWISLIISMVLINNVYVRILLVVVGGIVTAHLILLRNMHTVNVDEMQKAACDKGFK